MGIALIKNCDVSFRCVMDITSTLKKMSQIYNTHRKSNSDTIPTKTFNPLWIQQFVEMGIALMISFCSIFFCFTCVKYIFICKFNAWYVLPYAFLFSYAIANMPRKLKPSINAQQPKLGPISLKNVQWTPKTRGLEWC